MRGGLLALVVASLLVSAATAIAKPSVLKCTTDTGEQAADLTVDLDRVVMTWEWQSQIILSTRSVTA